MCVCALHTQSYHDCDTCTADVTALLQGPDPIFEKLHGQATKTLARPAKVMQSQVNSILILKIKYMEYVNA